MKTHTQLAVWSFIAGVFACWLLVDLGIFGAGGAVFSVIGVLGAGVVAFAAWLSVDAAQQAGKEQHGEATKTT